MDRLVDPLLTFLGLTSTGILVLGAAAFISIQLAKVRCKTAYAICLSVLFLPLLFPLNSVISFGPTIELPIVAPRTALDETIDSNPDRLSDMDTDMTGTPNSSSPAGKITYEKTDAALKPPTISWRSLIASAWICIVLLLSLRLLFRIRLLKRLLKRGEPVKDERTLSLVDTCASKMGLAKAPTLMVSGEIDVPIVAGFHNPSVILPDGSLNNNTDEALSFTLLHEMAHIVRRDSLTLPLENFVGIFYFFHPVVWWALKRVREDRECLCDDRVVRATGRNSSYADFLLNEIWKHKKRWSEGYALSFLSRLGSVSRRVHHILEERRDGMFKKMRDVAVLGVILIVLVQLVTCRVAPTKAPEEESPASRIKTNFALALPTDEEGVYYVSHAMEYISEVEVIDETEPKDPSKQRILTEGDWIWNRETGRLGVKVPVKDGQEFIYVFGKQKVPWEWRYGMYGMPIDREMTQLILDGRIAVLGEDYEIDEEKGALRFLKEELCRSDLRYELTVVYKSDSTQSSYASSMSLSNTASSKKAEEDPQEKSIRLNVDGRAVPTNDPMVFTLSRPIEAESLGVAIAYGARRSIEWLESGMDYTYNEKTETITLLKALSIDQEKDFLMIHGYPPEPKYIFNMNEPLQPGTVDIYLNGRYLEEGKGFLVDYINGRIAIYDSSYKKTGNKIALRAGNFYSSNCIAPPPPDEKKDAETR